MNAVHPKLLLAPLATLFLLGGCFGGDGGSNGNNANKGRITPTGISGLTYQTASQRSKTDINGLYRYYPGERLTLSVGDLQIAADVPVEPVVTPLEFFPEVRAALEVPGTTAEGLQSHRITEQQLIKSSASVVNVTRFLLALNWRLRNPAGSGIDIRDRVIQQLNAALPGLSAPIDFTVPQSEFAFEDESTLSPANQLLAEICFFPPGDELCEDPPTQAMIDSAPPLPENEEDIDPDEEYKEQLESKRDRILKAIRSLEDVTNDRVEAYLSQELDIISTEIAVEYYLDDFVADYAASDTAIKTVTVKKIAGTPNLADIEAVSTRPDDVVVHSFGWQSGTVDYFVAGESGGESEILINFRPVDTYRWVKKQLRVVIR